MKRRFTSFFVLLFIPFLSLLSQENGNGVLRESAVSIFLDCSRCDEDFIRREIPFVNYVRDRKEADVHMLVTRQSTGSGGTSYQINFIGQGKYQGKDDIQVYNSNPDETADKVRAGYSRMMAIGLMKYVGNTPLSEHIKISFDYETPTSEEEPAIVEDKWKSWVFDIDLTGKLDEQASYSSLELENDISAEKVTPNWKVELAAGYDENLRLYRIEDTVYRSERTSVSLRHLLVKSITEHLSAGGRVYLSNSSYSNNRFSWSIYPAVEYNIFPYNESSRKQLRFQYRIGYGYTYYRDTTLYNKIEEGLFGQQLAMALEFRQPWGSINTSLEGFTYLHDLSKYSVKLWAGLYLRIFKGLSLNIRGDAAILHNQLSLPKTDATPEEILLRQRQIASSYDYSINVGFSYTFGSIYNNVVNPRFGSRQY